MSTAPRGRLRDRGRSRRWAGTVAAAAALVSLAAASPAGAAKLPTEFSAGISQTAMPVAIARGADGNMWFTEGAAGGNVGRVTPTGTITEFGGFPSDTVLNDIAPGPGGNMWFTEYNKDRIGLITPSGGITEFPITPGSAPGAITTGPDGNLWYTELNTPKIGRMTPSGTVTNFNITLGTFPNSITTGPDGNLWFTEQGAVGKITTSGVITVYTVGIDPSSGPSAITNGPDGNLWFTELQTSNVARITPEGDVTQFDTGNAGTRAIAAGVDGNLWLSTDHGVARMTPAGTVTSYETGFQAQHPDITDFALGTDDHLWFSESGDRVGYVATGFPLLIDRPVVSGLPQVGRPLTCTGGLWATSLIRVARQWRRDADPIDGATGQSYTPTSDDLGRAVSCRVTATFSDGDDTTVADSDPVTIGAPETGPAGPTGPTGQGGATGPAGSDGAPGTPGAPGATGDTGAAGTPGATGDTGAAGTPGATGDTGAGGPAGSDGATGATGADGAAGPQGLTGPGGATGLAGINGTPGLTGPKGATGAKGATPRVTCTIKKAASAKKVAVTCKITVPTAKATRVTWRLVHAGRTVAHGNSTARGHRATLTTSVLGHLRRGHYTLRVTGQPRPTAITIA